MPFARADLRSCLTGLIDTKLIQDSKPQNWAQNNAFFCSMSFKVDEFYACRKRVMYMQFSTRAVPTCTVWDIYLFQVFLLKTATPPLFRLKTSCYRIRLPTIRVAI